jgi:hypothetical protein
MVRTGVVIGMPRCVVVSLGVSVRLRWRRIPERGLRPAVPGTVTWMAPELTRHSSQAAAAVAWLSTALPPSANTAAIRRPSTVSAVWPTANTPR